MNVTEWLLESDPAIRWQVMADLTDQPEETVIAERARVATEGWGARLLELQGEDGQWAGGAHFPASFSWASVERGADGRMLAQPWTATSWSLSLLRTFGLPPDSPKARRAVAMVRENSRWDHAGQPFFDGEVEPCINGLTVAIGSYFGEDVSRVVDRLLGEQMDDGGWNCEQESGSTRGSFHTTISVLEGLLEYQNESGPASAVSEARSRGEEYLLDRRLFRRMSDGEVIEPRWTRFSFPTWWHYDVLRGLDYLRMTGVAPDERAKEAIGLVADNRGDDGRWPRQDIHAGEVHFEVDGAEGEPSRWNTLRALRVLNWSGHDQG
ncbi:MAG TPA: hypothetical protein VMP13_04715 [Acidimicrobiia bacterium]|nr:hypothetical protein [Acidimicrobiia bacterium]